MALIAALLVAEADRNALTAAVGPNQVLWARSWQGLGRLVRQRAVTAAVADLHAEPRKDGVLRVFRFHERFPLTPVVVWGELEGRELYRLGKAGAADVILSRDAEDPELVEQTVAPILSSGLSASLDAELEGRVGEEGRRVVRYAADRIPEQIQVPDLARAYGMSVSTLERRCERWGLPTPGRLLLWLRVLWGLRWLLEPGRSVESVAGQLGYSSGAAFRRALKATVGSRPSPLRNAAGLERALAGLVRECPGDAAYRHLTTTG